MILEIKNYMLEHNYIPLKELCLQFKTSEDEISHVIAHWVKKGCCNIILREKCSSCDGCPIACAQEKWVQWLTYGAKSS
jgi:hypothetical protein